GGSGFPFFFFVLPVNSIAMRPLPRLLRYAPKAREGTLKLHFYLESISEQQPNFSKISARRAKSKEKSGKGEFQAGKAYFCRKHLK
ncbi:MAG: hypothetical protein SPC28_08330, partial [Alloprevotella sp.]|nr:hypothetical protein [Alloprevotella sp.]